MGKAKLKDIRKPASWESFPGMKEFWDAYVDIFWGRGGNTSYHDMLLADQDWLKQAYMANNEFLTGLEKKYMSQTGRAAQQYETGIEGSRIPIRMGTQKPFMHLAPASERSTQAGLLKTRQSVADKALVTGAGQAERELGIQKQFTPHKADMELLNTLKQQGMAGQNIRAGLPTQTTKAEIPGPSTGSKIASGLGVGIGLLDFTQDLMGIGQKYPGIWDTASGWGQDVWGTVSDWGQDLWGWLFS